MQIKSKLKKSNEKYKIHKGEQWHTVSKIQNPHLSKTNFILFIYPLLKQH